VALATTGESVELGTAGASRRPARLAAGSTAREAIRQAVLLAPGRQPKWLLDAAARASAELEDQ
jgi:hypothetical protein